MKILASVAVLIALCAFGLLFLKPVAEVPSDFKEVMFSISGVSVALENGMATAVTSLGGDAETTIRYFGNEMAQDLDGDGVDDIVFLVTQEVATRETYFFLVGALKRDGGYLGTEAVLIGKDIAPQTTEKGEGRQVVVNYAERAGEVSIGRSLYLLLDVERLQFGELVQDFEGEEI